MAYIVLCPYTKVEESFNMQAMHDILEHRTALDKYDHIEFPGVVPRTFIGALMVAIPAMPFHFIVRVLCAVFGFTTSKVVSLYVVRGILAAYTVASYGFFRRCYRQRYGDKYLSIGIAAIAASQFHFLFYASRPLPNTFAGIFVNVAMGFWLINKHSYAVSVFAFTTIIFRCDMFLYAGSVMLLSLLFKWTNWSVYIKYGVLSSIVSITLTLCIDSIFWQKWIWPELQVFSFNVLQNGGRNSEAYGVSPFHWYFYSALPRAMLGGWLLGPFALVKTPTFKYSALRKMWKFPIQEVDIDWHYLQPVLPTGLFIILYSFLPHKELRFVYPAIPMLNAVAARGLVKLYRSRHRVRMLWNGTVCLLLISTVMACGFGIISSYNYPGGSAMTALHSQSHHSPSQPFEPTTTLSTMAQQHKRPIVHIDNLACISGVTRFLERNDEWIYSKREGIDVEKDLDVLQEFDFLISEKPMIDGFKQVSSVDGLVGVVYKRLQIVVEPLLFIHRRNDIAITSETDSDN
jgi:alpha-1,6-mannosyltransferase